MNQLIERFAKVPRSQRALLTALGYLVVAVLFYFALISPTMASIDGAQAQKAELSGKRDTVRARADNRAAFEAQRLDKEAELKLAMAKLPDDREIPGLLSEIDGLARKSGLEVRKFQPLPEVPQEYVAEVPVQIVMDGSYHEVAIFFDRVSKMNRIVSIKDVEIGDPVEAGSEVSLTVSGKVVTFRFLTPAEIEQGRQMKKKDAKGAK